MDHIDVNDTIYAITEKYPETIDIFVSRGFPAMAEYTQRAGYGRLLSLKKALEMKRLNASLFVELLEKAVSESQEAVDPALASGRKREGGRSISVTGLLPCPVRIPLTESFKRFRDGYEARTGISLHSELKAASMGTAWVQENIDGAESIDDLPDLFISAGFDLFFDKRRIGRFRDENEFQDLLSWSGENGSFAGLGLADPDGEYSIIAVVPAVFLVNTEELKGRPCPSGWADLLTEEFRDSVSLPVGDFDLFNAILLTLRQRYGDAGVTALGRSMQQAMHPSQMVRSDRMRSARPAVTIMPYFFTKTVRETGPLKAVWPSDGAVLSPIFMLAKKKKREELKEPVEFFGSKETGEILSHQGLFPSLNPGVDNRLSGEHPFMWLGWEYIRGHDLSAEIARCEQLFTRSVKKKETA
jgi:ABC-type Fe3+ transport system substrate-binding protein